jgi:hypothetical protein
VTPRGAALVWGFSCNGSEPHGRDLRAGWRPSFVASPGWLSSQMCQTSRILRGGVDTMYRAFRPPLRRPLKPKQDLRAAVPGILCRQSSLQGSVCSDEAWIGKAGSL